MDIRGMVLSSRTSSFAGAGGQAVQMTYLVIAEDTAGVITLMTRGVFEAPRRAMVTGICVGVKTTSAGVVFKVVKLALDLGDEFTSRLVSKPK